MVLAHNLTAMNAQRQFNIVGTSKKKSTEKLSSGYKINRAADDAAGLTISEKMRSQIRGLHQASENCQDGVSLCQVADGALAETHEILQRINELSIQSANGTNSSSDRAAIQAEVKQLTDEIDRIATTTSFNERIYPLNACNEVKTEKQFPEYLSVVTKEFTNTTDRVITCDSINYNPGDKFLYTYLYYDGTKEPEREDADNLIFYRSSVDYGISIAERFDPIFMIDGDNLSITSYGYEEDDTLYFNYADGEKRYFGYGSCGVIKTDVGGAEYFKMTSHRYSPITDSDSALIHAGSESDMALKIPVNIVNATKKGLGLTEPEIDLSTENGSTAAIDRVKMQLKL